MRTEDIGTEVFFLPAASHVEKEGTFTNTQRLLQWREKALDPPGDCRSDLWFYYHLGKRIRQRLADDEIDRPVRELTWDYPEHGRARGSPRRRPCCARSTASAPTGGRCRPTPSSRPTAPPRCGCWIYCGVYADEVNQAARRKPGQRAEPGWRPNGAGPGRPTGASSTTGPPPTPRAARGASARRTSGGTRSAASGPGTTCPTSRTDKPPDYVPPEGATAAGRARRDRPVHHAVRRQGLAVRPDRAGRRADARPLRAARVAGRATRSTASRPTRRASIYRPRRRTRTTRRSRRALPVRADDVPADRAPHGGRHEPAAGLPRRAAAGAVLRGVARELAAELGLVNGGWATIVTARAAIEARVLVTERVRPLRVAGPGRPPGRPAVPLGVGQRRPGHRRRRQRPAAASCSTRTSTSRRARPVTCDVRPGRRPRGRPARARRALRRRAWHRRR